MSSNGETSVLTQAAVLLSDSPVEPSACLIAPAPVAKAVTKKRRPVKTNGLALWRKCLQDALMPPRPHPSVLTFAGFPSGLIGNICQFLDAKDVMCLYFSGDRRLQDRILNGVYGLHAGLQIPSTYGSPSPTFKFPSAFAMQLPLLRSITLSFPPHGIGKRAYESIPSLPILKDLPRGLHTLKLECSMTQSDLSYLKEFEALEVLHIGPVGVTDSVQDRTILVQDLPPGVTHLRTSFRIFFSISDDREPQDAQDFVKATMPCLEHLRSLKLYGRQHIDHPLFYRSLHADLKCFVVPKMAMEPCHLGLLPRDIERLEVRLNETASVAEFLLKLPPKVKTLKFHGAIKDFNNERFLQLPKTVTDLRFDRKGVDFGLLAGAWPHVSLTSLDIRGDASGMRLCDLPQQLASLRLEWNLSEAQVEALPPHLTCLKLPHFYAADNIFPRLSSDLVTLKLPNACNVSSYNLTRFHKLEHLTLGVAWRDNDLKHLPRSILHLLLPRTTELTDAGMADLPRGLIRLALYGDTLSVRAAQFLPASLQYVSCVPWHLGGQIHTLRTAWKKYQESHHLHTSAHVHPSIFK